MYVGRPLGCILGSGSQPKLHVCEYIQPPTKSTVEYIPSLPCPESQGNAYCGLYHCSEIVFDVWTPLLGQLQLALYQAPPAFPHFPYKPGTLALPLNRTYNHHVCPPTYYPTPQPGAFCQLRIFTTKTKNVRYYQGYRQYAEHWRLSFFQLWSRPASFYSHGHTTYRRATC